MSKRKNAFLSIVIAGTMAVTPLAGLNDIVLATSTDISVGDNGDASYVNTSEPDLFFFTPDESGKYKFEVAYPAGTSSCIISVTNLDAGVDTGSSSVDSSVGYNSITFNCVKDTRYRVSVSFSDVISYEYSFEKSITDSRGPIYLNTPVSGTMGTSDEEINVSYSFIPVETAIYTVKVDHPTGLNQFLVKEAGALWDNLGYVYNYPDSEITYNEFNFKGYAGTEYEICGYSYSQAIDYTIEIVKDTFCFESEVEEIYFDPLSQFQLTLDCDVISDKPIKGYEWTDQLNDQFSTESSVTVDPHTCTTAEVKVTAEDGEQVTKTYFISGLDELDVYSRFTSFGIEYQKSTDLYAPSPDLSVYYSPLIVYDWFRYDPSTCTMDQIADEHGSSYHYERKNFDHEYIYVRETYEDKVFWHLFDIRCDSYVTLQLPEFMELYPDKPQNITSYIDCQHSDYSINWYKVNTDTKERTLLEGLKSEAITLPGYTENTAYQFEINDMFGNTFQSNLCYIYPNTGLRAWAENDYILLRRSGTAELKVNWTIEEGEPVTFRWYTFETDHYEYIDGADSRTFTVHGDSFKDSYYCDVCDQYGDYRPVMFNVMVDNNPSVEEYDYNIEVTPGQDLVLDPKFSADDKTKADYLWYDSNGDTVQDGPVETLSLENITENCSYYCYIDDGYGYVITIAFYIKVKNDLSLEALTDEIVYLTYEDDPYEFKVKASALDTDGLDYEWELINVGTYSIQESKSDSCIIDPAILNGRSYLTCTVTDKFGNYVSVRFHIFLNLDSNLNAKRGCDEIIYFAPGESQITLSVNAMTDNEYPIYYEWDFLYDDGNWYPAGTKSEYIIYSPEHNGRYRCIVTSVDDKPIILEFEIICNNELAFSAVSDEYQFEKGDDVTLEAIYSARNMDDSVFIWKTESGTTLKETSAPSYTLSNVTSECKIICQVIDKFGNTKEVTFGLVEKKANPTAGPTKAPTAIPTTVASVTPTAVPTVVATVAPTVVPTVVPTGVPTITSVPSVTSSVKPTGAVPTVTPKTEISATPVPTEAGPTSVPSNEPTKEPTSEPTTEPSVTPTTTETDPKSENLIREFVDRIYKYVLNREPEEEGANFWTDELYSFRRTGAEVGLGFIFSDEFTNRNLSDEDFVTVLYNTFFGREPEEGGFKFWTDALKNGTLDRMAVANGFVYSQEWADTCARYGIRSGGEIKPSVEIKPSEATLAFVERMYTTAMNRASDPEGAAFWSNELSNFRFTGEQVGVMFFLSDEMNGFGLSDSEFVTRLYKTFMDREPEEGGFNFWVGYLADGGSREGAVLGFTRSEEFVNKCIEARILPY